MRFSGRIDPTPGRGRALLTGTVLVAAAVLGAAPAEAQEPACATPEARRFDFWIGEWDVANRHRNPRQPADTTWYETGDAVDRVYPILDGCAIVEHWEGYLSYDHVLGFSVRAWDPEKRAWVILLNWPGKNGPGFSTLTGTFEDGVGAFYREVRRPDGSSVRVRFRFADVTPESLRWDGYRSTDGGETWTGFWIMDFTRRDATTDRGLLVGPTRTVADRCDRERARAFDVLLGDWAGTETVHTAGGDSVAREIELSAWSILEGCAVMDLVTTTGDESERKRFRVRSFVPSQERWIQYSLDRAHPVFVRWEGPTAEGNDLTLVTDRGDGTLERTRWLDVEDDAFRRETAISRDGGASWTTRSTAALQRRGP